MSTGRDNSTEFAMALRDSNRNTTRAREVQVPPQGVSPFHRPTSVLTKFSIYIVDSETVITLRNLEVANSRKALARTLAGLTNFTAYNDQEVPPPTRPIRKVIKVNHDKVITYLFSVEARAATRSDDGQVVPDDNTDVGIDQTDTSIEHSFTLSSKTIDYLHQDSTETLFECDSQYIQNENGGSESDQVSHSSSSTEINSVPSTISILEVADYEIEKNNKGEGMNRRDSGVAFIQNGVNIGDFVDGDFRVNETMLGRHHQEFDIGIIDPLHNIPVVELTPPIPLPQIIRYEFTYQAWKDTWSQLLRGLGLVLHCVEGFERLLFAPIVCVLGLRLGRGGGREWVENTSLEVSRLREETNVNINTTTGQKADMGGEKKLGTTIPVAQVDADDDEFLGSKELNTQHDDNDLKFDTLPPPGKDRIDELVPEILSNLSVIRYGFTFDAWKQRWGPVFRDAILDGGLPRGDIELANNLILEDYGHLNINININIATRANKKGEKSPESPIPFSQSNDHLDFLKALDNDNGYDSDSNSQGNRDSLTRYENVDLQVSSRTPAASTISSMIKYDSSYEAWVAIESIQGRCIALRKKDSWNFHYMYMDTASEDKIPEVVQSLSPPGSPILKSPSSPVMQVINEGGSVGNVGCSGQEMGGMIGLKKGKTVTRLPARRLIMSMPASLPSPSMRALSLSLPSSSSPSSHAFMNNQSTTASTTASLPSSLPVSPTPISSQQSMLLPILNSLLTTLSQSGKHGLMNAISSDRVTELDLKTILESALKELSISETNVVTEQWSESTDDIEIDYSTTSTRTTTPSPTLIDEATNSFDSIDTTITTTASSELLIKKDQTLTNLYASTQAIQQTLTNTINTILPPYKQQQQQQQQHGSLTLIGAGPGDPSLITLAGISAIRNADILIVDRLMPKKLYNALYEWKNSHAEVKIVRKPETCSVMKAKKKTGGGGELGSVKEAQDELLRWIEEGVCVSRKNVVRIKNGDPSLLARSVEEVNACFGFVDDFNNDDGGEGNGNGNGKMKYPKIVIVPGVSSLVAAGWAVGVPLTHRGVADSVIVSTGRLQDPPTMTNGSTTTATSAKGEKALIASQVSTIVSGLPQYHPRRTTALLMAVGSLERLVKGLVLDRGYPADLPVAVIRRVTCGDDDDQQEEVNAVGELDRFMNGGADGDSGDEFGSDVVVGTLENVVGKVKEKGISSHAVVLIGEVVGVRCLSSGRGNGKGERRRGFRWVSGVGWCSEWSTR
ncbi:uroporphyrin-III C-methyltransferase [Blyttiomyces sp. JEL0837]|nr:uroporphyrin-III C-methyltransferase [Blyttiomyces sp. JEL0837]